MTHILPQTPDTTKTHGPALVAPKTGGAFLADDAWIADGAVHATGRRVLNRRPCGERRSISWPLRRVEFVRWLPTVDAYR